MDMATRDDMGGLMWVSDMLLPHDPNIVMMDTPSQSSFFSESPHPFDEMRDRVGGLLSARLVEQLE